MFVRAVHLSLSLLLAAVFATSVSADAGADYAERHTLNKRSPLHVRDSSRLRFPYGQTKVRGVSVGGWLVPEAFISPSVFSKTGDKRVIDEWSFGKYTSRDQAESIYRNHFDSFITEDDFAEIASYGLNHVRVPFPYWGIKTYPGDPYIKVNQYSKLKQAAGWAKKHNLKMIIELHTAPGGANPYDHGGHTNHSQWLNNDQDQSRTLEILNTLAQEFSQEKYSAVTAISLVNEPNGDVNKVYDFYKRGYNTVRHPSKGTTSDLLVIIGDVFLNPAQNDYWHSRMQPPKYQNVAVDTHVYQIFDNDGIKKSLQSHLNYYCSLKGGLGDAASHLYEIVGEWSVPFTDCAKNLNGRFKGSRYEGTFPGSQRVGSCKGKTGNANSFSDSYKQQLRRSFDTQTDAYEGGTGWIMWTWKVENHNADEWSYRAGVRNGWIPRDPTQRQSSC